MKRWQRTLLTVVVVVLLPIFGIMLHNLNQYDPAKRCSSPNTVSRACVTYVPGNVAKEQEPEDTESCGNGGCSGHTEYKFVVKTQSGKEVTISVGESRKDLRQGDSVELIRWGNKLIGINGHGRPSYLDLWHPLLAQILLWVSIALLAALGAVAWNPFRSSTPGGRNQAQRPSSNKAKVWMIGLSMYFIFSFAILEGLFMRLM